MLTDQENGILPLKILHHLYRVNYKTERSALPLPSGVATLPEASPRRLKRGAVRSPEGISGCGSSLDARLPNRQSEPRVSIQV